MGLRSYNLCPVVGESPIDCLGVKVHMWHGDSTIHCKKKISQGWGWGNGGGKATAVMPHGGGGEGHWSMDNSPTPPQVGGGGGGGGGLIIDRCIRCSKNQGNPSRDGQDMNGRRQGRVFPCGELYGKTGVGV